MRLRPPAGRRETGVTTGTVPADPPDRSGSRNAYRSVMPHGVGILAARKALESARPEPPKEPTPRAKRLLAHAVLVGLADDPALTINS